MVIVGLRRHCLLFPIQHILSGCAELETDGIYRKLFGQMNYNNNENSDNNDYTIFDAIFEGFLGEAIKIARRMRAPLLDLRHDRNRTPILHLIFQHFNADVDHPDAEQVEELVNTLIQKGIDVNIADDSDYTALHYASAYNNPRIVEALIAAGADVNAQVHALNGGITPLFFAVRSGGYLGVIDALIRAGADVSARDTAGSTPLDRLSVKIWDPATSNFIVNPDIVRIIVLLNNAGISQGESVALRAKWLRDGLTQAQIAEIVRECAWDRRRHAVTAMARAVEEREGPSSENENQGGGKHRRTTRKHRSKKRKNTRRS